MKKSILVLLVFYFIDSGYLKAQSLGFQFSPMVPAGKTAYLLKPGYGGELQFAPGDIDDQWKFTIGLGYYRFKPTQDTFNTYGIESSKVTTLFQGYEIIKKYSITTIVFGCTFKMLKNKKLSPTLGVDGHFSFITESEENNSGFEDATTDNNLYWQFAITPKLGASYEVSKNWLINIGIGRNMGFGNSGTQSYWKPYVLLNYYFN